MALGFFYFYIAQTSKQATAILHVYSTMAVSSVTSTPAPDDSPQRNFYASQIGGQKVEPLTYTGSPFQLLRADILSAWKYKWFLPFIVIPFTPWPSGKLDELCLRSYKNVWALFLHTILILAQLGFGVWLALGVVFWFPVWGYVGGMVGFWAFNKAFCVLINGWKREFNSKVEISPECLEKYKHEKWVFMNGVAVGYVSFHLEFSSYTDEKLAITGCRAILIALP